MGQVIKAGKPPKPMRQRTEQRGQRGFTLLELIITLLILSIMAGMAVPMLKHSIKRQREEELRANLKKLRDAIEQFHRVYGNGFANPNPLNDALHGDCLDSKHDHWPKLLKCLTEGLPRPGAVNTEEKIYFLREIPRDPMMNCKGESNCWGLRSSFQKPDEYGWDGEHIYDVYSNSEETGLNGTKYKEW